ncbi:MAG: FKBP-type peptidyl-prolyl cis-trans isomerase SlyD [Pseudomonadota bacterium]|nr:FKBP-type peptidyl-prolyl cis-trans isomerase SlyD [Pseudomonadota bacterium]
MIAPMQIQAPCVASLSWRLEDAHGQLIDELKEPLEFLVGGDDLFPKVEEALTGHGEGHETTLHLEPEHAFGDYDAQLVFFEERAIFPEHIEVGMRFEGPPPGSTTPDLPADVIYAVTEVYSTHVVLDGNHPLAGIALVLQIKVHAVREATDEEVENGGVGDGEASLVDLAPAGTTLH